MSGFYDLLFFASWHETQLRQPVALTYSSNE